MNPRTRQFLAKSIPNETLLDGGAAKCKALDQRHMAELEQRLGGTRAVRGFAKSIGAGVTRFMEADWAATDHALYYVSFYAGLADRWEWNEITQLNRTSRFGLTQRLLLTSGGEDFEWSTGRQAAESLLRIAREYIGKGTRHEGKRAFVASWGTATARFTIRNDDRISAAVTTYDPDEPDLDLTDQMIFEQAYGELEVSLGRSPSLQYQSPRPSWMPAFEWDPPLPSPEAND